MLILIAGITGNMDQRLASTALLRNHAVRGLGRNSSKLSSNLASKLDSFIEMQSFDYIPAIQRACESVDAVICTYPVEPRLQLEGQLILLRAAEKAGAKKFVAASWNADYRWLSFGDHECFDPYISFRSQVEMTSDIRPIYLMTGAFAESLFGGEQTVTSTDMPGIQWLPSSSQVLTWATGDEPITCVTMDDAAGYTIRILERPDAEEGGDYLVTSFIHSLKDMIAICQKTTGVDMELRIQGSLPDLEKEATNARQQGTKRNYWPYIGYVFALYVLNGTFEKGTDHRNHEVDDMVPMTLEDWFRANASRRSRV